MLSALHNVVLITRFMRLFAVMTNIQVGSARGKLHHVEVQCTCVNS